MKVVPILGHMSGKLAGIVASHNRAGQYFRQYVIPVDPKTLAQLSGRVNFGNSSNLYHSLDDPGKALWNSFAAFYRPKGNTLPGVLSGFNVFTAMGTTARNAELFGVDPVIKKNGSGTALVITTDNFSQTLIAPGHQLMTELTVNGGMLPLIVDDTNTSIQMYESGNYDIEISLPAQITPIAGTAPSQQFVDSNGNEYGIMMQISNPTQQQHNFKANPRNQTIAVIKNATITTPPSATLTLSYAVTGTVDTGRYKQYPVAGTTVNVEFWQVGLNGMQNKLASIPTNISA